MNNINYYKKYSKYKNKFLEIKNKHKFVYIYLNQFSPTLSFPPFAFTTYDLFYSFLTAISFSLAKTSIWHGQFKYGPILP